MSLPQSKFHFTPEEYLTFERAAELKHEYVEQVQAKPAKSSKAKSKSAKPKAKHAKKP